ncbi:hypothetical protein [Reyranella sp.]|uniref:hypothetical protein n=1 Tax=Reyranella sp. TaxID=1929291 RepID=UPI002731E46C|nr:hypothetical protein [Reyranella sp.]MDP2378712.1 hypothetical protein [Reyranella sp.]
MNNWGDGFPEWTELGQDSGLDPLGMQRPIEAIYQSLLPGISTITLRYRYYSFFSWVLKYYEDNIRNTDPAVFRVFQRRCETLFALICCRGEQELGIAGSDWAHRMLGEISGQTGAALVDFSVGADPDAEISLRYLRNKGGAFGGIYASQMLEMGLIIIPDQEQDNPIPICTERALPLAAAYDSELSSQARTFFETVEMGAVSISTLDMLQVMKPTSIRSYSDEHRLLKEILLGKSATPSTADVMRRSTLLMLLELADVREGILRGEDAKWYWYETSACDGDGAGRSGDSDVQQLWALYQACDLMRLAYEAILSAALTLLEAAPLRRMTLDVLVDELVGFIAPPDDLSWKDYVQQLLSKDEPAAARRHSAAMLDAIASGATADQVKASLLLIAALIDEASDLTALMGNALSAAEHFQSLKSEVRFLQSSNADNARSVIASMIRNRILKRHLWVASRKFRNQKAYTFLMEPEEGVLRYRDHFRVSPSSPRLDQALRFLKDIMLIDDGGVTSLGRAEMSAA